MNNKIEISESTVDGRGMYAKEAISKGEILCDCELLILSAEDTLKVSETRLRLYVFTYNKEQDCIVLGVGSLFNHSDSSSADYDLLTLEGSDRTILRFVAIRDIAQGEQIYIDYQRDALIDIGEYKENLY